MTALKDRTKAALNAALPLQLDLPAGDHQALYEAANRNLRQGSRQTKVDQAALFLLLADHARALAALHAAGIETRNR